MVLDLLSWILLGVGWLWLGCLLVLPVYAYVLWCDR